MELGEKKLAAAYITKKLPTTVWSRFNPHW